MVEIKAITYEEARLEYFRKQRDSAERRMNYWCSAKQADRVGWMEASDRASEAGMQYNFYKDALEALENQPKWISVEERLPEAKKDVLACGDVIKTAYTRGAGEGWFTYDGNKQLHNVTHWMPLPEPPEGKER